MTKRTIRRRANHARRDIHDTAAAVRPRLGHGAVRPKPGIPPMPAAAAVRRRAPGDGRAARNGLAVVEGAGGSSRRGGAAASIRNPKGLGVRVASLETFRADVLDVLRALGLPARRP